MDMSLVNIKLFCYSCPFFLEINPEFIPTFTSAAGDGDVSKVVDMVKAGMPIDIVDKHDDTALMRVACNNRTDVISALLQKGADVDKQNRYGYTALHAASIYNNTDVIRMLLQHGATRDIKSKYGSTPIDRARYWDQEEAVGLLEQY